MVAMSILRFEGHGQLRPHLNGDKAQGGEKDTEQQRDRYRGRELTLSLCYHVIKYSVTYATHVNKEKKDLNAGR
jgi:hypothetical protein